MLKKARYGEGKRWLAPFNRPEMGMSMSDKYITKHISISAVTVSLADVKKIFDRLTQHLKEEADRQTKELMKPPDQSQEDFDRQVAIARENAFRITVTIAGTDGQNIFGDTLELFDSPNLPDEIDSIYMTNVTAYQGQTRQRPPNGFSVLLDFSKPPLIDNNNPVSNPTPNNSNVSIEGGRDAWLASITDATMGVLDNRKNGRTFVHAAFVYDFGLMLFGLPLGLYVCSRLSGIVESTLGAAHPFLSAAAYVYLVLVGLWLYRILFGYTKWAFPTVELLEAESRSKKHRKFWYAITTGLVSTVIFEVWKYLS